MDPEEWSTSLFSPLHVSVASRNHYGTTALIQWMKKADDVRHQGSRLSGISVFGGKATSMLNMRLRASPNELRPCLEIIHYTDRNPARSLLTDFTGSPLYLAAELNEVKSAKYLLQSGADCDMVEANMWTPLHLAARNGHLRMVELLLDHRSNPNGRTLYGETALMLAAEAGRVEVFQALLARDADVNAKDLIGETVLQYCTSPLIYSLALTAGCHCNYGAMLPDFPDRFSMSPCMTTYILNSRPAGDHEPESPFPWLEIPPKIFKMLWRVSSIKNSVENGKTTMEQRRRFLVPAALRDDTQLVEHIYADFGLKDLELLKEAIIKAASWGRLHGVQSLYRRIMLHTSERAGTASMVYMASHGFPDLQQWVLVGQATDQLAIEPEGQRLAAVKQVEVWSGIWQLEIPLEERYGRVGESLFQWVVWLYSQDKEQMIAYSRRRCRLR